MNTIITPAEYESRISYNTEVAKQAVEEHGPKGIIKVLSDVYAFDAKPGELGVSSIIKNAYDIVPAVMFGYLPCVTNTGADGIALKNDEFVELEFKWTTIKADPFWISNIRKKVIYAGKANNSKQRNCFRSKIVGIFKVHTEECVISKKRQTILLVSEGNMPENIILDAFELDAETTHKYISGNNMYGHKRTGKTRTIKLGTFMGKGTSIKHRSCVDDGIRIEDYEKLLHNNLPDLNNHLAGQRYNATYKDLIQLIPLDRHSNHIFS